MANIRTASGAALGTVTDLANTLSTTANTVSGGINILNDMVQNIKTKRQDANLVEMITYRDNLINDASVEAVKREEVIRTYIAEDTVKQEKFTEFHNKLTSAFKDHDKINSEQSI